MNLFSFVLSLNMRCLWFIEHLNTVVKFFGKVSGKLKLIRFLFVVCE